MHLGRVQCAPEKQTEQALNDLGNDARFATFERAYSGHLQLLTTVSARQSLTLPRLEGSLRHQVAVLRRRLARRKVRLTWSDRALLVLVSRLWSGWRDAVFIVQPETVFRWQRLGFRGYWRWKSRPRDGRPRIPPEVRELIARSELIPNAVEELLRYAAANRDEREFGLTAERLDVERKIAKILTLSYGTHYCIGAAAARLQSRVVLEVLLARAP